jgi:hypothetical protein
VKTAVVLITNSVLSLDVMSQPFSARWAGVFVASTVGLYTFFVTVQASDAALLYVNNVNVADGWATTASQQVLAGTTMLDSGVNAFYDIVLDYKRSVSPISSTFAATPRPLLSLLLLSDLWHLRLYPLKFSMPQALQ